MSSKLITIPFGMATRKFYCHQCGQKLLRHSRTWIVRPGDPDYRKYAIRRSGGRITFRSGDVEVTEYDFRCPDCDVITKYDKQLVIEAIQKHFDKRCLTQSEIRTQETQANMIVNRKKTLRRILWWIVILVFIAVSLYLSE